MTRYIGRGLLAAAAATVMLFGPSSSVNASTYPPDCVTIVDDVSPDGGGTFTVTINGNPDNNGENFIFTFDGDEQTQVLAGGTASASFTAPAFPGTYDGTVVMSPDVGCGVFSITVEAEIIPPTGSNSTRTGLLIGAAALGLGGVMLLIGYRRRHQTAVTN